MRIELESTRMELTKQEVIIMRKDDPKYIEAVIKQLPSLDDPRERRIIEVMKEKLGCREIKVGIDNCRIKFLGTKSLTMR